jgi:L-threonylcarbamoyladenylate synthase
MFKKRLIWAFEDGNTRVIDALNKGEVIVGSSDTVIGLLAKASMRGFQKLNSIKRGRQSKPYLVLASSVEEALSMSSTTPSAKLYRIIESCWPGPLTIIVKARSDIPDYMKGPDGTIAVRVPLHQSLLQVLSGTGPLFSTSANLSGQPTPKSIDTIDPFILERTVYAVFDQEVTNHELPSTLLDCTQEPPCIVREGLISRAQLEQLYGPLSS